jgi:hypothetical protein
MRAVALILAAGLAAPAAASDCVVLLHGLGRTDASLLAIQEVLSAHGYRVVNEPYPSTDAAFADLVSLVGPIAARCGTDRLHFVTHSLGSLLVRAWLQDHRPATLGRVVMLAPPNAGSEVVDALGDMDVFSRATGPAGPQLGTTPGAVPDALGPATFEVGIIAGDASINPVGSALVPGPDDGAVGVDSTRLPGMTDHIVLTATHTFIMNNPVAMAQTLLFLRDGAFDHDLTLADALGVLRPRG